MATTVVYTKEELKKAIDAGYEEIIVEGELAEKFYKIRKVFNLSTAKILAMVAIGGGLSVSTIATRGKAYKIVIKIAELSGLDVAIILIVIFFGIGLIYGIYKDYNVESDTEYVKDPVTGKVIAKCKTLLKRKDK